MDVMNSGNIAGIFKKTIFAGALAASFGFGCAVMAEEGADVRLKPFDSNEVSINLEVGEMAMMAGNYDEASTAFTRAFTLEPRSYPAAYNLGYISQLKAKNEEAVRYYRQALRIRPESVDPLLNIGVIAMMDEKYDEAMVNFQKALAIDAKSQGARFNISAVFMAKQNYAAAYQLLSDLIKEGAGKEKAGSDIVLKFAQVCVELDKFAEADASLKELKPAARESEVEKYYLTGCSLFKQKKNDEAEKAFAAASDSAKDNESLSKLLIGKIAEFKKTGRTAKPLRIKE